MEQSFDNHKIQFAVEPIEKKPGRPKVFRIPRLKAFSHYQGSIAGERPKCVECQKALKKADFATCSEKCRIAAQAKLDELAKKLRKDQLKWISAQGRINKP